MLRVSDPSPPARITLSSTDFTSSSIHLRNRAQLAEETEQQLECDAHADSESLYLRMSPFSSKTPMKDAYSPGSTEPTSMPSDKCSSRGPSEGKYTDHVYVSSEVTDNERSVSDGSISPVISTIDVNDKSTLSTQNFESSNNSISDHIPAENGIDCMHKSSTSYRQSLALHSTCMVKSTTPGSHKEKSPTALSYSVTQKTAPVRSFNCQQFSNGQHESSLYRGNKTYVTSTPHLALNECTSYQLSQPLRLCSDKHTLATNNVSAVSVDSGYYSSTTILQSDLGQQHSTQFPVTSSSVDFKVSCASTPVQFCDSSVRPHLSLLHHSHSPMRVSQQFFSLYPHPVNRLNDSIVQHTRSPSFFPPGDTSCDSSSCNYFSGHSYKPECRLPREQYSSLEKNSPNCLDFRPKILLTNSPPFSDTCSSSYLTCNSKSPNDLVYDFQQPVTSVSDPGGIGCQVPRQIQLAYRRHTETHYASETEMKSHTLKYPLCASQNSIEESRQLCSSSSVSLAPNANYFSGDFKTCVASSFQHSIDIEALDCTENAKPVVCCLGQNFTPPSLLALPKSSTSRKRASGYDTGTSVSKRRKSDHVSNQKCRLPAGMTSNRHLTQQKIVGSAKTNLMQTRQSSIVEDTLQKLARDNLNNFLHEPVIMTLPEMLPPTPKPRFIRPIAEFDGLPSRLLTGEELDSVDVIKHWSDKYSCRPFYLRRNGLKTVTNHSSSAEYNFEIDFLRFCQSDAELLKLAMKRGSATIGLIKRLRGYNYLTELLQKAAIRGLHAPDKPIIEPTNIVKPDIDLLSELHGRTSMSKCGRVTPPLEKHLNHSSVKHQVHTLPQSVLRPDYGEEVITLSALKSADPTVFCRQCSAQLFSVGGEQPNYTNLTEATGKRACFCTENCLNRYGFSPTDPIVSAMCATRESLSATMILPGQPVMVQQLIAGKQMRQPLKRPGLNNKIRTQLPSRSWRGTRWFRHSAAATNERKVGLHRSQMEERASLRQVLCKSPAVRFQSLSCRAPDPICLPACSNIASSVAVCVTKRKKRDVTDICDGVNAVDSLQFRRKDNTTLVADTRVCRLCHAAGDADPETAGRLLNSDADTWIHVNCALWCYEAFETISGCLVDVHIAAEKAGRTVCHYCRKTGARLPCFQPQCPAVFHLPCAYQTSCSFHEDRSMFCLEHCNDAEAAAPRLNSLAVRRRAYIDRDEGELVARVVTDVHPYPPTGVSVKDEGQWSLRLRIGSLTMHHVGQLLPDQLRSGRFHTPTFIYPVGYSVSRLYWSYRRIPSRCWYDCSIEERPVDTEAETLDMPNRKRQLAATCPWFVIVARESGLPDDRLEAATCNTVWQLVLTRIDQARRASSEQPRNIFPKHMCGEILYGLTEPHIVRVIESLPGFEHLSNYVFKFGRMQLISDMPLAVNPTGCARSEPKLRTYVRRKGDKLGPNHANASAEYGRNGGNCSGSGTVSSGSCVRHASSSHAACPTSPDLSNMFCGSPPSLSGNAAGFGALASVSLASQAQSKSQQYRRLRVEWKTHVLLARSRIQGLGLFAARDLEKNAFIIEYLGETIRNEVANRRERLYEAQKRGVYMFRADDDCVVDATMCGGPARYVNHSCEPNCIAEVVNFDNGNHIIIIANQKIGKGDELTYDYKFDIEEGRWDRIPCLCGSRRCRQWMN